MEEGTHNTDRVCFPPSATPCSVLQMQTFLVSLTHTTPASTPFFFLSLLSSTSQFSIHICRTIIQYKKALTKDDNCPMQPICLISLKHKLLERENLCRNLQDGISEPRTEYWTQTCDLSILPSPSHDHDHKSSEALAQVTQKSGACPITEILKVRMDRALSTVI